MICFSFVLADILYYLCQVSLLSGTFLKFLSVSDTYGLYIISEYQSVFTTYGAFLCVENELEDYIEWTHLQNITYVDTPTVLKF